MRLYISLMLHRLWKQETLYDVAERFHVSRGWLQNALQATYSQASSIIRFAEVLLRDQFAEKIEELEQMGINANEVLAKFITDY
ncbi:unnamed protein product [Gongylonema pulchrum]|uniref:Helix-turn-helix domain-containing protein n=1 Tax=Gongylonema pulchrum TaxID=637853 RepID=A0A183DWY7_9BILA|nr:unnamed protein product [Gongylonema pulchrum]